MSPNDLETLKHLTNNEPWYQSRVTIGALVAILIPILAAFGITTDVLSADQLTAILMGLGSVVGGLIALYGRWKAKKPLGK